MPLDHYLPHFDFREIHSRRVAAEPADVLTAARTVTPLEVPLLVALMALRAGPRLGRLSLRRPIVGQFERAGFVQLAANERELVYGGVGRFWSLGGGLTRTSPDAFAGFDSPGYAKTVFDFRVERPARGGVVLVTETRIAGTDGHARRSFGRYWRLIQPGSALIRLAWLRAIAKRAERTKLSQPASSPSAPSSRSTSSSVV